MITKKMRVAAAATILSTGVGLGAAWPAVAAPGPAQPGSSSVRMAATSLPVGSGTLMSGTTTVGAITDAAISNLHTYVDRATNTLNVAGTITGAGIPGGSTAFTAPITAINGHSLASGSSTAAATQAATTGSCPVLSLTLGPLHLNLLGLVVDLNQVNLNITAVPGAGNLLGNLLCAVAGLLDGNSPLSGLSGLLNNLLSALGL